VIEETEIRCNEIRKEIYDFNRVLGGEENIRAKKFDADKIVKYFDDNIAHKVCQCLFCSTILSDVFHFV
jgi:hypothetical protein